MPKRRHKKISYLDEIIRLGDYDGQVRQIAVTGFGRERPTLFLTNHFTESPREIILNYARRNGIEDGLGTNVNFFHKDSPPIRWLGVIEYSFILCRVLPHSIKCEVNYACGNRRLRTSLQKDTIRRPNCLRRVFRYGRMEKLFFPQQFLLSPAKSRELPKMSISRRISDSEIASLPAEMQELSRLIDTSSGPDKRALSAAYERAAESILRRRRILNLVQEALSQLRLDVKYLMFDLETTRRERDQLQSQLEENERGF